jgi:hypothetical protein
MGQCKDGNSCRVTWLKQHDDRAGKKLEASGVGKCRWWDFHIRGILGTEEHALLLCLI